MEIDIPDALIHVGIGVAIGALLNKCKRINGFAMYTNDKEKRRVVDVMGDTLGYTDNKGNIIKVS